MEKKIYKEANKGETETTINVLYSENTLSICTNKEELIVVYTNDIKLQKKLCRVLGKPAEEYIKGRSILGSTWKIKFEEKSKITKMILKANIFGI